MTPLRLNLFSALLALALVAALGCQSDREAGRDRRPDIVMIMLDTARPDLLSAYGHPRPTSPWLETFAAQGTRFDRAYSSSSWTLPAHGSLFTGTSPKIHGADQTQAKVSDALPLLAEELADAGYQTAGFSANVWVSELGGLDRGFEHFEGLNEELYSPHILKLATDPRGEPILPGSHYVAGRVLRWLDAERDPRRPLFLFVNLVEPHLPYLPDWKSAQPFFTSREERWLAIRRFFPKADTGALLFRHYDRLQPLSTEEWSELTAMYEGALRLTDELAGAIVQATDAAGDPASALTFVLSDHGENLGEHGHLSHIFNLYDTNLRIALVARGPGFGAGTVNRNLVHITDVHSTALHAAGLRRQPGSEGLDLRREPSGGRIVTAYLDFPRISLGLFRNRLSRREALDDYRVELEAAIGPRFKLIRAITPGVGVAREELYDLIEDPGERASLDPDAVDANALGELRRALAESSAAREAGDARNFDALEDDVREGLRALGYLGSEPAGETESRSESSDGES